MYNVQCTVYMYKCRHVDKQDVLLIASALIQMMETPLTVCGESHSKPNQRQDGRISDA